MIPRSCAHRNTILPFPRMSGDDPKNYKSFCTREHFSPHKRG